MNRGYSPAKSATGAEELFLLIALIVLAATAGSVPGRRIIDDPLTPVAVPVAATSAGVLKRLVIGITAEGEFRVGLTGSPAPPPDITIAGDPCAPEKARQIADASLKLLGADTSTLGAEVHPAPRSPVCAYVQARNGLQYLLALGRIDRNVVIAAEKDAEK